MGFLADENVPRPIIERLRTDGFTVRSIFEESRGISDADVLSRADEAGLLLITQDQDFGELAILRRCPSLASYCCSWPGFHFEIKSSASQNSS